MKSLKKAAILYTICESPLGLMLVAKSDKGVCAISFSDNPQELVTALQKRFSATALADPNDATLEDLALKINHYIDMPHQSIKLPLDLRGTVFQQTVWGALKKIPLGNTVSYIEIAQQIGMPKAVRAVANACGANPIAVIIPCHRVVKNNGSLSGYRWGVERKQWLLERELKKAN